MDFRFSPEEEAFREEVRRFLDEALTDEVRTRFGLLDTPERQRFGDRLAEKGWLGLGFPTEYGGAGEGLKFAPYILNQELLRAQAPIVGKNVGIIANVILRHGSEELKREFLPRIFRNEIQWAIAYTEPEAGSDLANLQCRAVLEGDEFVVTGIKRFITSAHFADYYWTAVRTDPAAQPKHRGISLLIIDASLPGITVTLQPTWTRQRRMFHFMPKSRATTWQLHARFGKICWAANGLTKPSCQVNGFSGTTSRTRSRPTILGLVRALWTREASSRSVVDNTPVMVPRTRSRRTRARVSIPSMPRMRLVAR